MAFGRDHGSSSSLAAVELCGHDRLAASHVCRIAKGPMIAAPLEMTTVKPSDIGVYPDCNELGFPAFMPRPKRIR